MNRVSIKVVGQSGQGINIVGEILAKALKRSGFYTFAYREYPSLIKGGHSSYQVDVSDKRINSATKKVDFVVVLNRQATKWYLEDLKQDGIVFHIIDNPRINHAEYEIVKQKNIKFIYIPAMRLSVESGGNDITSNVAMVGSLWKFFGLDHEIVKEVVRKAFEDKPKFLDIDLKCLESGYSYANYEIPSYPKRLPKPDEIMQDEKTALHLQAHPGENYFEKFVADRDFSNDYLLTGNQAIGFGAINAGVRIYYSYPMTPTSDLMDFLAEEMHETGMIVKQVEDEITAAAMTIGSMHMGVRAMTATSGGGFDLMTEHVSLAGMLEVPFVCVLGQRPGPATGLPTWTMQGDLMTAIFAGHGEFSRCVLAPSSIEDCFYSIQEALNIAEVYQIPVILLADKLILESISQFDKFDLDKIKVDRGEVITEGKDIKRYQITGSGISPRWFPGDKIEGFNSNSDEHDEIGNVTEEGEISSQMLQKRLKKEQTLRSAIPDPEIVSNNPVNITREINLIGWGSTFTVVSDAMNILAENGIKVNYMNVKYLWPLKTEEIVEFLKKPNVLLIEGNHNSQLGNLIRMQTGIEIKNVVNRFDGRPFFVEELVDYLLKV